VAGWRSDGCEERSNSCYTGVVGSHHQFAEINGYRLRYRIEGEGPLAVFGHGLMGSMEQVEENLSVLDRLLERVRLMVYDARGHGQSDGPRDPSLYNWETLGQDMASLIAHAGEKRAFVGGASMGAATALWVALERPELVRGLVLVMPPPLGEPGLRGEGEKQALQVLEMLSAAVQNFGLEKTVELARNFPGFASTPEAGDERARWMLKQNPLTLAYAIRGLMQSPFHDAEAYRRIRAPVLVMAHEGDGLHPARAATLLGAMVPDCTVHVAPGADYWPRHPEEFLAEVHAFFDRVG
jgi:pimeloyl-ACP methyl ester carboxylesterase